MIRIYQEFSQDLSEHEILIINEVGDESSMFSIPVEKGEFIVNVVRKIAEALQELQK